MKINKPKVFVVGKSWQIAAMFNRHGGFELTPDLEQAHIVVWPGGADVSPALYRSDFHPETRTDPSADARDVMYYDKVKHSGRLLVGICRGAQFLNVMSGGVLYQDVDAHALPGDHSVMYHYGDGVRDRIKLFQVTSTHHQMMSPRGDFHVWGDVHRSTYRDMAGDKERPVHRDDEPDTEIVWYPLTNCLCFQPHPEYRHQPTTDLFFICVQRAIEAMRLNISQGFISAQMTTLSSPVVEPLTTLH